YNIGIDYDVRDKRVRTWYGGEVVSSAKEYGYGDRIRIKTDVTYNYNETNYPVYTAYAHLADRNYLNGSEVKVGDQVRAGQDIGTQGNTGHSFGTHVDLQLWIEVNGRKINVSPNALESQIKSSHP
ncbi:MAG TPA: M23 family metallopeptidase, partial [Kamptonema sp.]|nr:M23 family metallopeptidase [Kamptonema sp.]